MSKCVEWKERRMQGGRRDNGHQVVKSLEETAKVE